jgi:DnaJ-class molecular chaperone
MDYYSTLGVDKSSSQEEIKKAYRKLAAQHHPDRGGNTAAFQKIQEAYATLSDPQRKAEYDNPHPQFHFNTGNTGFGFDPFAAAFQGSPFEHFFRQGRSNIRRKNRDLNIRCTVTFKQSFTGANLEASYNLPNGKKQTVIIDIPAGIQSGQTIRYPGMGDDSDPNLPKGDLNVTVLVEASKEYERRGDDLIAVLKINPVEAMTGCSKIVNTLSDTAVKINIAPGTQHGTDFVVKGQGFRNINGRLGNLIVLVGVDIPKVIDPNIKEQLEIVFSKIK